MPLVLVTAPTAQPLSVADVRGRVSLPAAITDGTVTGLIATATDGLDGRDGMLGRALLTQTWDYVLDHNEHRFWRNRMHRPSVFGSIELPLPPVQSITSITYYDSAGSQQTLSSDAYRLVKTVPATVSRVPGQVWPAIDPRWGGMAIRFVAGYGDDGTKVPEPIKSAIALKVSALAAFSVLNPTLRTDTMIGVSSQSYDTGAGAGAALDAAIESLVGRLKVRSL